jgi:hypothetical protein
LDPTEVVDLPQANGLNLCRREASFNHVRGPRPVRHDT